MRIERERDLQIDITLLPFLPMHFLMRSLSCMSVFGSSFSTSAESTKERKEEEEEGDGSSEEEKEEKEEALEKSLNEKRGKETAAVGDAKEGKKTYGTKAVRRDFLFLHRSVKKGRQRGNF